MELKPGIAPPSVNNSSCSHPRYNSYNFIMHIGVTETLEALLILFLTLSTIIANALVLLVINNRRYAPHIHQQPRYLITSLALNDLTIGLLITPFGLLPALFHCWPYGEIFCQIQALLRGALSQQSAVILVCMAIDRYMHALHPRRYYMHSSKKGCVAMLSCTWIMSLTVFGLLVLPRGYYFNNTGLLACEPFYSKPSYRILATCAFYFPTTMVLMYCYGSSYHMSNFRLNDPVQPLNHTVYHHPEHSYHNHAAASPTVHQTPLGHHHASVVNLSMCGVAGMSAPINTIAKKIVPIQKHSSNNTSRSMAAISLGFIVMVTPWTLQGIVHACTGSKLPPFLDFLVTWLALSNSFWNPFMYWLLNADFRRLSRDLLPSRCTWAGDTPEHKPTCCHITDFEIGGLPLPPAPPTSRPPLSACGGGSVDVGVGTTGGGNSLLDICPARAFQRGHQHGGYGQRYDSDYADKYWGDMLERTVSSGNLQRHFAHHSHHGSYHGRLKHEERNIGAAIKEHERSDEIGGGGGGETVVAVAMCDAATETTTLSRCSNSEPKLCDRGHQP